MTYSWILKYVFKKFLTSISVGHCSKSRHSLAGTPAIEILKDE